MTSGVYLIHCETNHKLYVGSACSFNRRWAVHKHGLRNNLHHCKHLQRAWNKYGPDAFIFIIVEHVPKETMIAREQQWLDSFERKMKFNSAKIAGNTLGVPSWNKGLRGCYSEETLAKMSVAKKGKTHKGFGPTGHKQSPEHIAKRVAASKATWALKAA